MENSLIWYGREGERRKPGPNVLFTQPWDENQVGNGEIKYDYYFTPYLSQYPSLTTPPPSLPPIFLFLPLKFCYESQNMDFRSKSPLSHTAWPLTKSYHFENTNFPDLSEGPLIIANEALFSRYVNLSPPSIFHLFSNTKLAAQPYTYPKFMVPRISFDYFWILQYEPNHHPPKPQLFQLKFSKLQLNRSQKITMKENKQIDLS